MLVTPFLTDLDSRAAVKGSRDPLGIQQIWTRLGRHAVGNLTTVSNSVRDFTTLLLGYYFAELLSDRLGPGSELATFLKWEQIAAYARAVGNDDWAFRGTERVRKNLEEPRVTLSADRAHQILGNQKIYGLWGLYTVPARASDLVDGDPPRLTGPARELVERTYLPLLATGAGPGARRIRDVLQSGATKLDPRGKDSELLMAVAAVLHRRVRPAERMVYRTHLLHGGPNDSTEGCQRQLADLLGDTLDQDGFTWSPASVRNLVKSATAKGEAWQVLASRLHRIQTSESVVAPMSVLFAHLLGLDGKSFDLAVSRVRKSWGTRVPTIDADAFDGIRPEIGAADEATGARWSGIARCAASGDYGAMLELLFEQNQAVMTARGGAPWIEKREGNLHVRFRDEQGRLPDRDELSSLWRFPYFLGSLRTVASALRET